MWVLNEDKNEIINLNRAENVFIEPTGTGETIRALVGSGRKELGKYDNRRKAEFALRELFEAIADEDQYFEMPSEREAELGTLPVT